MRRIAAAVAAVALVVVALVIRNRIDENERRGPFELRCATELTVVCEALDGVAVTTEAAGATADRVAEESRADFDGWLTPLQWRAPGAAAAVAHTRVAVAIWRDRAAALRRACGNLTAKCLGDAAARGTWAANRGDAAWGQLKLAFADPATDASGLAALAAGTAGVVGTVDIVPAALEASDDYLGWLGAIARARVSSSAGSMLAAGPSVADAYIGLEAEVTAVLAQAARRNDVEVVYLAPVDVEATLVVARDADRAPQDLSEALVTYGWRPAAEAGTRSVSAGALAGIRKIWKDTVR